MGKYITRKVDVEKEEEMKKSIAFVMSLMMIAVTIMTPVGTVKVQARYQ